MVQSDSIASYRVWGKTYIVTANDSFDNHSDAKGPEPEALALGRIGLRIYAFVSRERIGGIMTDDITRPRHPVSCNCVNNRDFAVDGDSPSAGDLAPEGIALIARSKSPIKRPLLAVANEVSGTVTLCAIKVAGRCKG